MRGIEPLTIALIYAVPLAAVAFHARVQAVRDAIEHARLVAGLSEKACACLSEVDQSQWTKQRALGGILGRLVALPREFWIEFLPRLGAIVGVPVVVETEEALVERVVRKVMKATLRQDQPCESAHSSAASSSR